MTPKQETRAARIARKRAEIETPKQRTTRERAELKAHVADVIAATIAAGYDKPHDLASAAFAAIKTGGYRIAKKRSRQS